MSLGDLISRCVLTLLAVCLFISERLPKLLVHVLQINKRGETVDEKIKRLDNELARYKDQIKKTRPGPAQEAVKARAMRVLKQKRMYEGQRDMLYNQTFNLDQVGFAAEGIKDAQQTVGSLKGNISVYFGFEDMDVLMTALKSANKELKGMMKTVKIQDIDNLQDEMMDLMDVSHEIQESLGRSYSVPDDIDEEELMGELNLPSAPAGHAVPAGRANTQAEDELGLPAVPRASLRG
ncbi:hypothetical protein C3L33_16845, partial [Rhododendron williamsianum]